MTSDPVDILDDLADHVAKEFEANRQPDEFKDVSLVTANNDPDRPTLTSSRIRFSPNCSLIPRE
jgi:hypothetical protein